MIDSHNQISPPSKHFCQESKFQKLLSVEMIDFSVKNCL